MPTNRQIRPGPILVAGVFFVLGAAIVLHWMRRPSPTPFSRGQQLAQRLGCFACHGPGGVQGVPNPNSQGGIPSWDGGTAMMYLHDDDDIREFILYGKPLEERDSSGGARAIIAMPAYESRLNKRELDNLVAYVKGVSAFYPQMPHTIRDGLRIAREAGCFGCHGPMGHGGIKNPGSFKGIIPGWYGDDYLDAVRSPKELREWMENGITSRFENNPIARYFMNRQIIKMPGYHDVLSDWEMERVEDFIDWMRKTAYAQGRG